MLHQYRKLYTIDAEVCEEECLQACPRNLNRYQNKEEVVQQRLQDQKMLIKRAIERVLINAKVITEA